MDMFILDLLNDVVRPGDSALSRTFYLSLLQCTESMYRNWFYHIRDTPKYHTMCLTTIQKFISEGVGF